MLIRIFLYFIVTFLFIIGCDHKSEQDFLELNSDKKIKRFASPPWFYFVGIHKTNSSIYKYNFEARKSELFWFSKNERVIDLAVGADFKTTFFVTARKYSLAGAFPFIDNARLYRIDPETEQITMLREIGDAIQIYSYWSDEGNFNLFINSFDTKENTYVIQNSQLYNRFGRILTDHKETSDLLISGYPAFKVKETRITSYDERYRIFEISDSVFIRDLKLKQKIFVKRIAFDINQVEWMPTRSLVVFNTIESERHGGHTDTRISSLNIFDFENKKLLKTFQKAGLYRFVVTNDFLIFDEGFTRNSYIQIIDLNNIKEYDRITISGGCGLRNIPLNPFEIN